MAKIAYNGDIKTASNRIDSILEQKSYNKCKLKIWHKETLRK